MLLLVKLLLKRTKQALLSNTTERGSIKPLVTGLDHGLLGRYLQLVTLLPPPRKRSRHPRASSGAAGTVASKERSEANRAPSARATRRVPSRPALRGPGQSYRSGTKRHLGLNRADTPLIRLRLQGGDDALRM